MPGILAWAVQGCLAWQEHGLEPPEAVRKATDEYRSEMDLLGQFLEDSCIVANPGADEPIALLADIYTAYKRWCEASELHPINRTRFGSALAERGFKPSYHTGQRTYKGLAINPR